MGLAQLEATHYPLPEILLYAAMEFNRAGREDLRDSNICHAKCIMTRIGIEGNLS